jgi:hypothetical protein
MAISFAACAVPGASPSVGPEASASNSVASQTPTGTLTPTERQNLATAPLDSQSAAPANTPFSCGEPRSSGRWTGLKWTVGNNRLPAKASDADGTEATFGLFGWSKGYLGFRPDPVAEGARTQKVEIDASTDGLNWSIVQTLTITSSSDLSLPISIGSLVEGPAGLIALGEWAGQRADFPAKRPVTVILRSADARHWTYTSATAVFGSAMVSTVDARSAGYIATGLSSDGKQALVWVSSDGSAWRKSQLPGPAGMMPGDATAFAGGYVLLGAVVGGDGPGPATLTPSLWWSGDGLGWNHASVPGMRSGGTLIGSTETAVGRINDYAILATEYTYNDATQTSTQTSWVSTDGKTWCPDDAASAVWPSQVVSDRDRGLLFRPAANGSISMGIWAFEDDFSLVELAQTGSVPPADVVWAALGPAGLVAADYSGTVLYLGVPTNG